MRSHVKNESRSITESEDGDGQNEEDLLLDVVKTQNESYILPSPCLLVGGDGGGIGGKIVMAVVVMRMLTTS